MVLGAEAYKSLDPMEKVAEADLLRALTPLARATF
jgi:hypothetical protein